MNKVSNQYYFTLKFLFEPFLSLCCPNNSRMLGSGNCGYRNGNGNGCLFGLIFVLVFLIYIVQATQVHQLFVGQSGYFPFYR